MLATTSALPVRIATAWPHAPFMQRLRVGFEDRARRQSDGAVYSGVEGSGIAYVESPAGPVRFAFEMRDHFVAPSWQSIRFQTAAGCVLFSFSDRPAPQALGIHPEERIS